MSIRLPRFLAASDMKRLVVFLLAAAAVAAGDVTEGAGAVVGLERVADRVWTTSSGVTVLCGAGRSSSDRQALLIEVQSTRS